MPKNIFCPGCGQKSPAENGSCQFCSASFKGIIEPSGSQDAGNDQEQLILVPSFIPKAVLAGWAPMYALVFAWGTGLFGVFRIFLFDALGFPHFASLILACVLWGFLVPRQGLKMLRKIYAATTYRFSRSRLDYFEGFWAIEEKTIDLKNILEVYLRKGIIQRRYDLGTIVLSTAATGRMGAVSGIRMYDIKNPDSVYKEIREWIEDAKKNALA
jgi:membrane protein YdbS with pleckstrin-like domain